MKTVNLLLLFKLLLINCKAFVIPDQSSDSVIVENVAFIKLGTYSKRGFIKIELFI